VVSLTATPVVGWSFSGWSGDLTGSVNPASVTMDGNKVVTATFTENPPVTYSLTLMLLVLVRWLGFRIRFVCFWQCGFFDGYSCCLVGVSVVGVVI